VRLPLTFKGRLLPVVYRPDPACSGAVVVELKALAGLTGTAAARLINYLKASGLAPGLLLNFGAGRLEFRRFIRSGGTKNSESWIPR